MNPRKSAALAAFLAALLGTAGCDPNGSGYRSCAEADKAGATPLHKGDPGWNDKLDRNKDGIACGVNRRTT